MSQHRLAVMSVSDNLPMAVGISIGYAEGWLSAAKDCVNNKKYLKAYEYYCDVLSRFNQDEEQKYLRVAQIVAEAKAKMEPIGKIRVLDIPLDFKNLAPFEMDPFCVCSPSPAKGRFCEYCYSKRPVTVAHVHYKLQKNSKERLAEFEKSAVLAATKRKEALVLEKKLKPAREKVKDLKKTLKWLKKSLKRAQKKKEYLKESLQCTREEATDAEDRVKRYRGR